MMGAAMASKKSVLTPEIAAEIKKLAANTDLYQHEIAALVKLNQGRASEVLAGKRFQEVLPAT